MDRPTLFRPTPTGLDGGDCGGSGGIGAADSFVVIVVSPPLSPLLLGDS